jgi:alpha-amylase
MAPIRFVFGLHLHQPVGNFDHVFEQHVQDVYRPILERLSQREFLPLVLHLSGPLLEWLEEHDSSYLDMLGGLVSDGRGCSWPDSTSRCWHRCRERIGLSRSSG